MPRNSVGADMVRSVAVYERPAVEGAATLAQR